LANINVATGHVAHNDVATLVDPARDLPLAAPLAVGRLVEKGA